MSVYVIAIGGTGTKIVEAVCHLAAAGIYTQGERIPKIEILFVDPDKGNGNLKEADGAIATKTRIFRVVDSLSKSR